MEHQTFDVVAALVGRRHRNGGGGGRIFPLAAEREAEEGLLGVDSRLVGGEIQVEGRIVLLLFGDVVVAEDLVYGEVLFGQCIPSETRDAEQDLCGVEDGHVSEIPFGYGVVADHLGEESGRPFSEGVVDLGSEVSVGDVGADDRIGLEEPGFDIFPGIQSVDGFGSSVDGHVSGTHLLIVGDEVASKRIVHFGATSERQGSDKCEQRDAERTTGVIESLHRIGCNYRKSPLRRVSGIQARVFRSSGPIREPWGPRLRKPRPPHRHNG